MQIELSENLTIIRNTTDNISLFLGNIPTQENSYKNKNLILDVSIAKELTPNDFFLLNKLATQRKKEKKSFVVVVSQSFDFNQTTDSLMFVPSLQEALDVVEIEEIERDLGI